MSTLILRQFITGHNTAGKRRIPTWVTCRIESTPRGERLSITAVEGPTRSGNAWGGCGQITTPPTDLAPGIDAARLYSIWGRWHLNDMRMGCEHQRVLGWECGTVNDPGSKHHNSYRCHVLETEHPQGTLCKPCPECGYEHGSAWLFEPLPAAVVDFITALPHSNAHPWGQR